MRPSITALAAAALLVATAACSGGADKPGTATARPSPSGAGQGTSRPSSEGAGSTPTGSPGGSPTSPTSRAGSPGAGSSTGSGPPAAPVLADGRHPARVVGIDTAARTVRVDVVQFFTGAAAEQAAREDGAVEVPPPNDVWIRNENALLRTLPVIPLVPVVTNTLTAAETGSSTRDVRVTLSRLARLPHVAQALFWVSVEDGTVTALREQYLP